MWPSVAGDTDPGGEREERERRGEERRGEERRGRGEGEVSTLQSLVTISTIAPTYTFCCGNLEFCSCTDSIWKEKNEGLEKEVIESSRCSLESAEPTELVGSPSVQLMS